jgi:putative tricarboxylic transport membrane protein
MSKSEKIFIFLMIGFAVVMLIAVQGATRAIDFGMGPEVWPKLTLGALVIACGALLAMGWNKPVKAEPPPKEGEEEPSKSRMLMILVVSLVYAYAMTLIGFIVSTPIYIIIIMYLMQYRKPFHLIGYSLLMLVVFYLIFINLSEIRMPRGYGIFRELSFLFY